MSALLLRRQKFDPRPVGAGFVVNKLAMGRSQWPRGLRRRSAAARLLRLWIWMPPGTWMSVCCECCVLSGRGLCDGLITGPEESYRLWCVVVCDQDTSRMRRTCPALGRSATGKLAMGRVILLVVPSVSVSITPPVFHYIHLGLKPYTFRTRRSRSVQNFSLFLLNQKF